MPSAKSSFVDKVLGRLGMLDPQGLKSFVEQLAQERSFLETLFDTIEDGVLVVDEKGRLLYFNQAAARLVGFNESTAMDVPVEDLLPGLNWKTLHAIDHEGGEGVVRQEFEVDYPRPRFLRLYAAPLDGKDRGSNGMALILHDATEARQQTHEAIESERIQALTLLAASVAHEIGNPLNALSIHLQLLERELKKLKRFAPGSGRGLGHDEEVEILQPEDAPDITAKVEKYLDVAKGEVNRLDYIITQFLEAIRPSEPNLRKGSLNDVVKSTLAVLRPELDNRGQVIRRRLSGSLPDAFMDSEQIKQALVNLIKNSMQAMTRGGIISVKTGTAADGVWVSLADTGSGIPQEQINRIFEPYYTTKKKVPGLV